MNEIYFIILDRIAGLRFILYGAGESPALKRTSNICGEKNASCSPCQSELSLVRLRPRT